MGLLGVAAPPLPRGFHGDGRLCRALRRGRRAVERRGPAARHGLRALSGPRDGPSAHGARRARGPRRRPGGRARHRLARRLPRRLARLAAGEDALRGRRAVGLRPGLRRGAPRRPARAHGEVGQEEAQAAQLRRRREPRGGSARRRGARRRLRRARELRRRGARGALGRAAAGRRVAMLDRYRRVLGAPHVRALVVSSILARTPVGMISLALVLYVERLTGSFGSAGAVTAAFAIAAGIASPLQGRLIDRVGQARVLVPCVYLHAAALLAVVALGQAGAPIVILGLAAAVAGAGTPPVGPALRPLWPQVVDDEALLPAAYALDSILIEAVFSVGPLLTAALVAIFSPVAAIVAGAAIVLTGTLWFAALPPSRAWRGEPSTAGWAGPLHAPGMITLLVASIGAGACFGVFEVALPAFGKDHGSASLGGPLITAWALGSMTGGILYGALSERLGALPRVFLCLIALLPLVSSLTLLATSIAAMAALVPLAGIVIAPGQATQNQLVGAVAPVGTITEAYTWVLTGLIVGLAGGNALAGALVDASGWRAAIFSGCVLAGVGALLAFLRRRTLRPLAAVV